MPSLRTAGVSRRAETPVARTQRHPILLSEGETRGEPGQLVERTAQAFEVCHAPIRIILAYPPTIEVDEIDLFRRIEQDIVGIEIRMVDIGIMKPPDAPPDLQPYSRS